MSTTIRIDKWLWAARFFKTRSLASHALDLGRILHNQQKAKPAQTLKLGDTIEIHNADQIWVIVVLKLQDQRGSASIAQTMYQETPESLLKRQQNAEKRRLEPEPAAEMKQKPTKRQRQQRQAAFES